MAGSAGFGLRAWRPARPDLASVALEDVLHLVTLLALRTVDCVPTVVRIYGRACGGNSSKTASLEGWCWLSRKLTARRAWSVVVCRRRSGQLYELAQAVLAQRRREAVR